MAYVQTYRPSGGGGTPTQNLEWADDLFEVTDPFTPGSLNLSLSHNPVAEAGLFVTSEVVPLYPDGYTFVAPNQITIEFGADPITDTDDGIWHFRVRYQYAV